MKFNVTTAVYPMGRTDFPFIPGTLKTDVMDTSSGLGKTIWDGYLTMQKEKLPLDADNFRDATNLFFKYLFGGGSRDNWPQVRDLPKLLE